MDPFMARMLERSRAQLSKLPNNIAENARLREKQLLEAYYSAFQTENAPVCTQKSGAATMQPAFKIPSMNNLGYTNKSIDRHGKENKSPPKEIRKPNIAVVAPNTTELYPRRPPRCVYNSPLIIGTGDGTALIFENRYKPKMKSSLSRVPPNEPTKLNIEPTEAIGSKDTVEGHKHVANPYPSLPKINTSYDLDRLANKIMATEEPSTAKEKSFVASSPKKVSPTPPKSESVTEDVNVCSGGVKKMVEKFSQNSLVPAAAPTNSPVRVPPKFEKFSRSPLASSTVNSPVKVVVPKLYHILEPSRPEFRDAKEAPRRVETPKVLPADSKPILPAYETIPERPEPVFTEDSNMSVTSADSAPVAVAETSMCDDSPGFSSLRVDYSVRPHIRIDDNKEKYRRPSLESFAPFQTSERKSPTCSDRVKRLTIEASVQRSLVAQTSKALYLCRTAKQFKESQELVEGERILLLSCLRSQAAVEEIKKCGQPPPKCASRGSLTVSDIFVPLKWDIFPKLDRSLCPQWFVCVLTLGETVQATEVVQLVDSQPILKFPGSMHLSDLACDFRARLQLYAFRSPQHSQKKSRIVRACKMLRRPTRNCLGPAGSTEELMYLRNPAFKMIGCTELTVGLINQQQPVSCSLEQVPMVSLIKGTINFRLSAQLLNTREHSGFLNVLRPAGEGNAWQRWWCHLDGKQLRCWNYPSDQEDKEAVFSIELLDCLSEKVAPAPRVLCSRPRTLMLESQRCRGPHDLNSTLLACSPDSTIVRHFLSCDSVAEMTEWASAINECLEALRLWNIVPEMRHDRPA